jgi:alpha-L-fucosidase 2
MDHAIIKSLFKICIRTSEILNEDHAFADTLGKMLPLIAPYQIGKYGQLQEWLQDKDDPDNHHRHVSHLWTVHPGNEINWEQTPELMRAARQSLVYRGDEGTGWSLAWKINLWARFLDGDHAAKMIQMLLSPAGDRDRRRRGGVYPNLFDAHPPFQIDGNFGGAAGIMEMLLQSHMGQIELMPAYSSRMPSGQVKGACARGGFELDFSWKDGMLQEVHILSKAGKPLTIKYRDHIYHSDTKIGQTIRLNGQLED